MCQNPPYRAVFLHDRYMHESLGQHWDRQGQLMLCAREGNTSGSLRRKEGSPLRMPWHWKPQESCGIAWCFTKFPKWEREDRISSLPPIKAGTFLSHVCNAGKEKEKICFFSNAPKLRGKKWKTSHVPSRMRRFPDPKHIHYWWVHLWTMDSRAQSNGSCQYILENAQKAL